MEGARKRRVRNTERERERECGFLGDGAVAVRPEGAPGGGEAALLRPEAAAWSAEAARLRPEVAAWGVEAARLRPEVVPRSPEAALLRPEVAPWSSEAALLRPEVVPWSPEATLLRREARPWSSEAAPLRPDPSALRGVADPRPPPVPYSTFFRAYSILKESEELPMSDSGKPSKRAPPRSPRPRGRLRDPRVDTSPPPRRRWGQVAMAPSPMSSRTTPTTRSDCAVRSSPRRTRAPKRSITSSSAPVRRPSAQLAFCARASGTSADG